MRVFGGGGVGGVVFWDSRRRRVRARLEGPPRGVVHFLGSREVDLPSLGTVWHHPSKVAPP